jgi:hypothetical protein
MIVGSSLLSSVGIAVILRKQQKDSLFLPVQAATVLEGKR